MQRSFIRFSQPLIRRSTVATPSLTTSASSASFLKFNTNSSKTSTPLASFSSSSPKSLTTIPSTNNNMKINLRFLSEAGLSLYSCMSDDDGGISLTYDIFD
ncbi:hypothetical protein PPL_10963 [Heterostelium album PN500]|uniref:Uncharacterized protein n=1 Tax=Heterostelium pallidum (strain ATCC 26659 / Pp 5 / PN500) TaxID=670386 RepID=D3BSJ4_HETP5|nr:hypothetical protein PPL_10963 [Heterostelium album PN500]EFA75459.1 hypothetical protein PPL_10963 [Heterostelium album PN500]|eukprot:XP_020427593.1 hypothetical protein PPL_10963 [Heterostelium album PN500]